ncbi:4Fe-4S dicluster domain-containing protein [Fibrobacterota bacterium]
MIGILTDITKCIGCHKCVEGCAKTNKLGKHIPIPQHAPDGLGANRWTSIINRPDNHYVRKQCRHCLHPACVSACIVGALQKDPNGPVFYEKRKCMGCRYCMMACPYGIPKYEWDTPVPYIKKCTMCYERVKEGKQPGCTKACPTEATIFGDRDELLKEARRRIKAEPQKYINRVFGEFEVGGTSVLYLSDIPLDFLGWKDHLGKEPLPDLTWHALKNVPAEFFGMGAVMTAVWWIIERRQKRIGSSHDHSHGYGHPAEREEGGGKHE